MHVNICRASKSMKQALSNDFHVVKRRGAYFLLKALSTVEFALLLSKILFDFAKASAGKHIICAACCDNAKYTGYTEYEFRGLAHKCPSTNIVADLKTSTGLRKVKGIGLKMLGNTSTEKNVSIEDTKSLFDYLCEKYYGLCEEEI